MTDQPPQWQPGQPPPRPSGDPQQPQPYDGQSGPPPQGGWQGQQQPGGWQGQQQPGGWQGQQEPGGAPQGPQLAAGDERTWMLLAHLSAPLAAIFSLGWLSFLGPLVVWMLRKEDSQAVRTASAGAFNFNLSFWLMNIV